MKHLRLVLLAVVAFLSTITSLLAEPTNEWTWDIQPNQSVALQQGETVVWRFQCGPEQPKPFFHPVGLPDGRVVTWNSPPDHAWHHGLWFAWKYINGVNYWEPKHGAKKPDGRTEWDGAEFTTGDDGTARIEMDLAYRPAEAEPVLTERRVVEVSAPDATGQYHFDWTATFTAGQDVELNRTPPPGKPGGVAWGGYAGLSVRMAKELVDRQAVGSAGPITFEGGTYRGRAVAMDYQGTINGEPIGIAIFDHPSNVNHPTPWYVIRANPMSYFSPAVICDAPHTLKQGESFTLRYRITIHPAHWNAARLQREHDATEP